MRCHFARTYAMIIKRGSYFPTISIKKAKNQQDNNWCITAQQLSTLRNVLLYTHEKKRDKTAPIPPGKTLHDNQNSKQLFVFEANTEKNCWWSTIRAIIRGPTTPRSDKKMKWNSRCWPCLRPSNKTGARPYLWRAPAPKGSSGPTPNPSRTAQDGRRSVVGR